jgi:hypothetical protein
VCRGCSWKAACAVAARYLNILSLMFPPPLALLTLLSAVRVRSKLSAIKLLEEVRVSRGKQVARERDFFFFFFFI